MLMIRTVFKMLWLSCRKVKDNPHDCIVCNAFFESREIFMVSTRKIPLGSYYVD